MRPGALFLRVLQPADDSQPDLFAPIRSNRVHDRLAPEDMRIAGNDLFEGGPPTGLQTLLGLMKPGCPNVLSRAFIGIALGWLPLLLLTAAQSLLSGDRSFSSFAADYGVHARLLIAVPLLVCAEGFSLPRLSAIVRHFRDAGLIPATDAPAFTRAVRSTLVLRDSMRLEIALLAFAITIVVTMVYTVPPQIYPQWHRIGMGTGASPAGWWHDFIGTPLLVMLLLGWVWRLLLWTRFLFLMARLRLRLVAAHPDHAGGLQFAGISAQAFSVVAFALGVIAAGTVANRVVHDGAPLLAFSSVAFGLVVLVLILFAGPLLVFMPQLLAAWRRGVLEYGALARSLGLQMERRWLNRAADAEALEANDFSATTDLYSIVGNVYAMNVVPLSLTNVFVLVGATLLPFAPVVLMSVSPDIIIQKLTGMLL